MDDKNLEILSGEVDELLVKLCIKHKLSPLLLSAVFLARMLKLNQDAHSESDYKALMFEIISGHLGKDSEHVLH
jgi:hypothetical protein